MDGARGSGGSAGLIKVFRENEVDRTALCWIWERGVIPPQSKTLRVGRCSNDLTGAGFSRGGNGLSLAREGLGAAAVPNPH
jgi:hypothetical protein